MNARIRRAVTRSALLLMLLPSLSVGQDAYEGDDAANLARLFNEFGPGHSFHRQDDEDWLVFYSGAFDEIHVAFDDPGSVDVTDDGIGTGFLLDLYRHDDFGRASFVVSLAERADAQPLVLMPGSLATGFYYLRSLPCHGSGLAACATAVFPEGGAAYSLTFFKTFGIPNPGLLRGFVRDAMTGRPVARAFVETSGNAGTISHSDGSYALSDNGGSYTGVVAAGDYLPRSFEFTLLLGATTELDLTLTFNPVYRDGFE